MFPLENNEHGKKRNTASFKVGTYLPTFKTYYTKYINEFYGKK